MRTLSFARVVVAACYVAIYAGVLAVAWLGRSGVGGGMAFTAPIMLGLPWTPLFLAAFVLLEIKPDPNDATSFIVFFIVPPALNVLAILFAGRRRRKPDGADV